MNMKFDSVRGGFATEMTDEQLECVYGGTVGVGASASLAASQRIHSFSGICDINIFSLNAIVIPIINIADCTNQTCANDD